MNIPTTKTKTLCQAERFCEGLKMLADECGMTQISHNDLGSMYYYFNDGSSVGGLRAHKEAGLI